MRKETQTIPEAWEARGWISYDEGPIDWAMRGWEFRDNSKTAGNSDIFSDDDDETEDLYSEIAKKIPKRTQPKRKDDIEGARWAMRDAGKKRREA